MTTDNEKLQQRLEHLEGRLAGLEESRVKRARHLKRAATLAGALALTVAFTYAGHALSDPSSPLACLTHPELYCFAPNSPARAAHINSNFAQAVTWTENKVGDVHSANITSTGNFTNNSGFVGVGGNGTPYAHFSHNARTGGADYALLQHSGGTTYLNASAGTSLNFRIGNATKMQIDSAGVVRIKGMQLCDCEDFGNYTLFANSAWYTCPNNKVLQGIYSTGSAGGCDSMHCLEQFRCCRVCGFELQ